MDDRGFTKFYFYAEILPYGELLVVVLASLDRKKNLEIMCGK
jgi:hypothetical protein